MFLYWNDFTPLLAIPVAIFSGFFAWAMMRKLQTVTIGKEDLSDGTRQKNVFLVWFVFPLFCSLTILLFCFAAYYPGVFSPDSFNQLQQAESSQYSDWHPVLHTLLFFTLPLKLFGTPAAIVPAQLVSFSLAEAYVIFTMRKALCPKWFCCVTFCYTLFNPVTTAILMYPWKDCAMAIFALVLIAYLIQIAASDGMWLKKPIHSILFATNLGVCTLMRHNAILLTFPILLFVLITYRKRILRQAALVGVCSIVIIACVKGPVYKLLRVEKPDRRQSEILGMCMTMLGNAVTEAPEKLDDKTKSFLYTIATSEEWESNYVCGSWNNVKFATDGGEPVENAGVQQVLQYTWNALREAPKETIDGFLTLSSMVWSVDTGLAWDQSIEPGESTPLEGVKGTGQAYLCTQIHVLRNWIYAGPFRYAFLFVGLFNYLLFALSASKFGFHQEIDSFLLSVPILCYNFGTMLLLSGFDFRFFYFNFVIFFPLLFLILRRKEKNVSFNPSAN
jgi:hypothetical protein